MADLLLDTHAFVWATVTPERLGPSAIRAIKDPTATLHVSAASAWELAIKHQQGKLAEAGPLVTDFNAVCARLRARPLSMTSAHALRAGEMSWDHRDPFDRMLAAQAIIEGLAFVTRDRAFTALHGLRTIW